MIDPMFPMFNDEERLVLEARTRLLAQPVSAPGQRATVPAIEIQVAGERYAIDARVVLGVIAMTRLAPLPHAPPHVAGLIARGAEILPAFHLHAVLDLPLTALPEHGRAVILGRSAAELALVVEAVVGVSAVALDALAPVPASFSARARALMRGLEAAGVPVLDGAALLASDALIVDIALPRLSEEGAAQGITRGVNP
jgi:purine-binding chemotaxis protein CheW